MTRRKFEVKCYIGIAIHTIYEVRSHSKDRCEMVVRLAGWWVIHNVLPIKKTFVDIKVILRENINRINL